MKKQLMALAMAVALCTGVASAADYTMRPGDQLYYPGGADGPEPAGPSGKAAVRAHAARLHSHPGPS